MKYTPVFLKDGKRIVILDHNYMSNTTEKAWKIGMGSKMVECIKLDMNYDGETIGVPDNDEGGVPRGCEEEINGVSVFVLE